jgi:hypothetical protein
MFPKIESSLSSVSVSKSATAKWYCLREFENEFVRQIKPSSSYRT